MIVLKDVANMRPPTFKRTIWVEDAIEMRTPAANSIVVVEWTYLRNAKLRFWAYDRAFIEEKDEDYFSA